MNTFTRSLLVLAIVGGAIFLAMKFTPHHHAESPFITLYHHLSPAPLVTDNHAPADQQKPLVAIDLPDALGVFEMQMPSESAPTFKLYQLQIFQVASVLLILAFFLGVPSQIRSGTGDKLGKVMAGWAMWVRDEMVYPVMGKDLGSKFLPYFLTLFFFLVFINLMGLVPGSYTPTASIYVTGAMAVTTLVAMVVCGMVAQGPVAFWKNLVPHVPLALWPLMFIVELIGLLVKPFALMVRLFANMSGGHMVVLSFMGLIFFFGQKHGATIGYASAPIAVGFAVFIMIIESFVALLQAYIFTQLSIIFIGASVHPEH